MPDFDQLIRDPALQVVCLGSVAFGYNLPTAIGLLAGGAKGLFGLAADRYCLLEFAAIALSGTRVFTHGYGGSGGITLTPGDRLP